MSIAGDSLRFCQMFEGELLAELMLRYWEHPRADDADYRNGLIENAAAAIRASMDGNKLMEDIEPSQMNFVAAVWYAEWAGLQSESSEISATDLRLRESWLETVRRAMPSCFCNQDDLPK
ncbi:hypothetical protein [Anaerobaca lacustris]|uniref:Uncharacterized protein n=1 Tax=Anaerobaca lacustris TaxID=3044600 RepID=A0AAW6TYY6_9BACT|nr:hypothetical protein [Sedimentisphaerales bacterium M17dextr]